MNRAKHHRTTKARARAVVAVRAPSRPTSGDGHLTPEVAVNTSPTSIPRRSTST